MAVEAVQAPTGKALGATTKGTTAGVGVGGAGAIVLVWVLDQFGVDMPAEVAMAVSTLIGMAVGLFVGKMTPTDQVQVVRDPVFVPADENGDAVRLDSGTMPPVVPDGGGSHRATPDETPEDVPVDDGGGDLAPVVTDTTVTVDDAGDR